MDFSMDNMRNTQSHHQCICGKSFSQAGGLKNHLRSCSKSKKRLASVFAQAKEVWTPKKRIRLQHLGQSQLSQAVQSPPEEPATSVRINDETMVRMFNCTGMTHIELKLC